MSRWRALTHRWRHRRRRPLGETLSNGVHSVEDAVNIRTGSRYADQLAVGTRAVDDALATTRRAKDAFTEEMTSTPTIDQVTTDPVDPPTPIDPPTKI
ncbi:hypothetical protein KEM60_00849 [Austwickia sp. TVS 96-490-7B]|uniref:antitoxin n=1 Tax=Austwickia sp. TVS 96-490-7B TaxID=2830843 RepID=UPI001C5A5106|nr:antitoxin [Austwickia sp. TVS 96-490-7B]MBW3084660.1 hypothetical protein [Austwickia sp. TVS 96-490-7B]